MSPSEAADEIERLTLANGLMLEVIERLSKAALEARTAALEEAAKICDELIAFDEDDPGETAATAIRAAAAKT